MIVVLVLMTSCHISLKWKIGPVTLPTQLTLMVGEDFVDLVQAVIV